MIGSLRLGFLHLAPVLGDLDHNRRLIEYGTTVAARHNVDWVLSGELVVSGYEFEPLIGTDWIEPNPSRWLGRYATLCGELGITAFVSEPERTDNALFNTAWVIGRCGRVLGYHRKLSPTPGSEDWSSPGSELAVTEVDGVRVGLLVCADAYRRRPAEFLCQAGAELLVSLAAWRPGPDGPNGEWEQRSSETGVPMLVCNRTGREPTGDFTGTASAVIVNGRRLLEFQSPTSALFIVHASANAPDSGGIATRLTDMISVDLD